MYIRNNSCVQCEGMPNCKCASVRCPKCGFRHHAGMQPVCLGLATGWHCRYLHHPRRTQAAGRPEQMGQGDLPRSAAVRGFAALHMEQVDISHGYEAARFVPIAEHCHLAAPKNRMCARSIMEPHYLAPRCGGTPSNGTSSALGPGPRPSGTTHGPGDARSGTARPDLRRCYREWPYVTWAPRFFTFQGRFGGLKPSGSGLAWGFGV